MRISDWSSDVCSSDLALLTAERIFLYQRLHTATRLLRAQLLDQGSSRRSSGALRFGGQAGFAKQQRNANRLWPARCGADRSAAQLDRANGWGEAGKRHGVIGRPTILLRVSALYPQLKSRSHRNDQKHNMYARS